MTTGQKKEGKRQTEATRQVHHQAHGSEGNTRGKKGGGRGGGGGDRALPEKKHESDAGKKKVQKKCKTGQGQDKKSKAQRGVGQEAVTERSYSRGLGSAGGGGQGDQWRELKKKCCLTSVYRRFEDAKKLEPNERMLQKDKQDN